MAYLLAIDAGTGSCRAALFTEAGAEVAAAGTGWAEVTRLDDRSDETAAAGLDLDRAWKLLAATIREALGRSGVHPAEVRAVSAASLRGGFVLMDAAGRELWSCGSTAPRVAEEVRRIRGDDLGFERRAYERSGQTLAMAAIPRLLWLEKHAPHAYERAAALLMLSDWIAARLTGEVAAAISNACTTGLVSLRDRAWDPTLADRWRVRSVLFSPLVEAGTVVGSVSGRAAAETGLAPGTPVVAAGGDAQVAALGLGSAGADHVAVVGGSFWQQIVTLAEARTDPSMRVRVNCHVLPDRWEAETIAFHPGATVAWFARAFGPRDEPDQAGALRRLTEAARRVPPGSHGVIAIFSNAMDYADWRHAAPSFLNLPLDQGPAIPAVLFRSFLESTAVVTRENLRRIRSFSGAEPAEVVFGGKAAGNELWARILADTLQLPVRIPRVTEATALGAAVCAGAGVGVFDRLAEGARQFAHHDRVVEPDPGAAAAYDELAGRWAAAYPPQLQLADRGVTTPLWSAPG